MKKLTVIASVIGLGLFTAGIGSAQTQDSATASGAEVTAQIVAPIAITHVIDLDFGDIVPSAVAGTVTVATTGAREHTAGVTLGNDAGSAATFDVTGENNAHYSITLPEDDVVEINDVGDGDPMDVDDFTSDPVIASGVLDASGEQTISVGATLYVGESQDAGAYSGTFSVTVTYD